MSKNDMLNKLKVLVRKKIDTGKKEEPDKNRKIYELSKIQLIRENSGRSGKKELAVGKESVFSDKNGINHALKSPEPEWNPALEIARKEIMDMINANKHIIELFTKLEKEETEYILIKKEGSVLANNVSENYQHIVRSISTNSAHRAMFLQCIDEVISKDNEIKNQLVYPENSIKKIDEFDSMEPRVIVLPDDQHKKEHIKLAQEMKNNPNKVYNTASYHTNRVKVTQNLEVVKIQQDDMDFSKKVAILCFFGIFLMLFAIGAWFIMQTGKEIEQRNMKVVKNNATNQTKKVLPSPEKNLKPATVAATSKKPQNDVVSLAIATKTSDDSHQPVAEKSRNFQYIFPGAGDELIFSIVELPNNLSQKDQKLANQAMKDLSQIRVWWEKCPREKLEQFMLQKRLEEYSDKYKELFLEIKLRNLKKIS